MVFVKDVEVAARVSRIGGLPLAPEGFSWPRCSRCGGPLRFLLQLLADDLGGDHSESLRAGALLSFFMCDNEPGQCEAWNPEAGGNRAYLFAAGSTAAAASPGEAFVLPQCFEIGICEVEPETAEEVAEFKVVGWLGGEAEWWETDMTPACSTCGVPMGFVAQMREGYSRNWLMNFGGGEAFVFACPPCDAASVVLQG
ncbi:protein of unknown function [Sinosporangium album]|uniref:DUF1963 domain-containing protein n=2 Tax=Sinosporangium album TaxID=504805 RepID=A0A1G7WSW5_9ACTN|nr:protein of unknown function [Sinosporangium album]